MILAPNILPNVSTGSRIHSGLPLLYNISREFCILRSLSIKLNRLIIKFVINGDIKHRAKYNTLGLVFFLFNFAISRDKNIKNT